MARDLVPLFARQDDEELFPKEKPHKLLFVTKSNNIKGLLSASERRNVVVSFSLNAPVIAARYEQGAPHPYARLQAAAQCQEAGYEIRLRIDPIIPLPGWQVLYEPLLERIAHEVDANGLRFTLGTIRHNLGLRDCARKRGKDENVFYAAISREGSDRRYRLSVELRHEVYRWFMARLPKGATMALCKETEELWRILDLDPVPSQLESE